MGLRNTTETLVQSFGSNQARLVRVEVLVLFTALVWLVLELSSSYRRLCGRGSFRLLIWTVHTLSTVLAPYIIGLLQAGPFRDQTFVLWGTFLLLIQVNSDPLSPSSSQAIVQWKRMLVQQLLQIFLVLLLIVNGSVNGSGGNKSYSATIWIFWIYGVILILTKSWNLRKVSITGGLEVEHSKALADYMVGLVENQQGVYDASTMKGYGYIFHGEEELASELPTAPEYRVGLKAGFITIDYVWSYIDSGSDDISEVGDKEVIKKLALSFTLFKLLKRRFCGYRLHEAGLKQTLDLVLCGLLSKEDTYVRAFGIIEDELVFLYEFLYTRMKTSSPYIALPSIVMVTAIVWNSISGAFSRHYHHSNLEQRVNGTDVIRYVTIVLLAILMFMTMAVWEQATHFRALQVEEIIIRIRCHRTNPGTSGGRWHPIRERRSTWERKLGQYALLLNFDYDPWNALHFLSLGLVGARRKGQRTGKKIKLANEVIISVLSRFKENCGRLENGQSAVGSQFSWACTLPSHIHTILVWHIATSQCKGTQELHPTGDRLVAESLSGYCAYLVAFVPGMLPGHVYDTQLIFDAVVMEMRRRGHELLTSFESNNNTILGKGIKLARELRDKVPDEAQRWKLLADFWAEFILFLAPSDNVEIHAEKLAAGGEFMTHLWALLTHAGILERPSSKVDPPAGSTSAQDMEV